jgi:hypothetical protein
MEQSDKLKDELINLLTTEIKKDVNSVFDPSFIKMVQEVVKDVAADTVDSGSNEA